MKVNQEKMTAEINLMENNTYIVKEGRIEVVDALPQGFGKQIISWQNGKPVHTDISYSKKL
ncbi:DUF3954 domain-containing protein [Salipaludibacillus sp. CF4.18]|uniref:DUF3954 domain-containing protein n=1 Tax=Salipaludibacillus sp. CF4.18 TaxID=3373081 RepID=UPI003EE53A6A